MRDLPYFTRCYWPTWKSTEKVKKAVRDANPHDGSFKLHPVRVFYQSDIYEKARFKLNDAMFNSEVETDKEDVQSPKRCRKPNNRYETSDSEGESPRKSPRISNKNSIRTSPRRSPRKKLYVVQELPKSPAVPKPTVSTSACLMSPPKSTLLSMASGSTQSAELLLHQLVSATNAKIIKILEEIKTEVRQNSKLIMMISREKSKPVPTLPGNIKFPVVNKQQLLEIEEALSNAEINQALVSNLTLIGGETVENNTRRVMTHVISNALCVGFNWIGKGNKDAFKSLRIKQVILDSVRNNHSQATDSIIERIMSEWLRYAKDREGGEKGEQRKKIKENNNNNSFLCLKTLVDLYWSVS